MLVIRERKHIKQKEFFQEQMIKDYLTGLYNHRYFQEQLRMSASNKEQFALIFGDIDHFKSVNDNFGHLIGDEVLAGVGEIFKELALKYKGQAFRYGGEEFAFLLPKFQESELSSFFSDLYSKLAKQKFTEMELTITLSFGAAIRRPYDSVDQLLHCADKLLYQAKASGKNCAVFDSGQSYINKSAETNNESTATF